ncbi:MAG: hypothetical protein LBR86_00415, partial [Tannerella sp.]|nr:hypothetical protein [Tannerella sp.]
MGGDNEYTCDRLSACSAAATVYYSPGAAAGGLGVFERLYGLDAGLRVFLLLFDQFAGVFE